MSFPFRHRLQNTESVDNEHRLKAMAVFSMGSLSARIPSPDKAQSHIRLATGASRSQTPIIITWPLRLSFSCRRFDGKFENGLPEGHGIMMWASGDVWEGEFKQGLVHGQGTFRSSSDSLPFEYRGGFANGKFEGHGSCRYRGALRTRADTTHASPELVRQKSDCLVS